MELKLLHAQMTVQHSHVTVMPHKVCHQWIVGFMGTFIPMHFAIRWASLRLAQIVAHATGGGTPTRLLCRPHFFAGSTSHLLHTTQKSVMDTADFGTHLSC